MLLMPTNSTFSLPFIHKHGVTGNGESFWRKGGTTIGYLQQVDSTNTAEAEESAERLMR